MKGVLRVVFIKIDINRIRIHFSIASEEAIFACPSSGNLPHQLLATKGIDIVLQALRKNQLDFYIPDIFNSM